MKLAKKILACVIALALTACLGVVAFADDVPSVLLSGEYDDSARTLTVTMSFDKATGHKAATLFVNINTDEVQYVSSEGAKITDENNNAVAEGLAKNTEDLLSGATITSKEFTTDTVAVATYTLKVKDGVEKVTLTVNNDSIIDEDITVANAGKSYTFDTKPDEKPGDDSTTTTKPAGETTTSQPPVDESTTEPPIVDPATTTEKETTTTSTTTEKESTTKPGIITKTGDASIAVIAGVSALAAVAFVVTKKK